MSQHQHVNATTSIVVPVVEPSQTAQARRVALSLARRSRLSETDAGRIALVTTEAATNLVKHGGGGEMIFRTLTDEEGGGVEMLALDRGPGIRDVAAALSNGYSTAGSPGTGLGALRRVASVFDLYSAPGTGTAVLARVTRTHPSGRRPYPIEYGGLSVPYPGEENSGDAFAVHPRETGVSIVLSDGLGHGPGATEASAVAVETFAKVTSRPPATVLDALHQALRPTRGGAVAVAEIDVRAQLVRFAGIGNISAAIVTPDAVRRLVSHNGILGHEARRIAELTYPWTDASLLVLHSDGLTTHWDLARYPGLAVRHPGLVAAVLYRDFKRGRDDVTVVAARCASAASS